MYITQRLISALISNPRVYLREYLRGSMSLTMTLGVSLIICSCATSNDATIHVRARPGDQFVDDQGADQTDAMSEDHMLDADTRDAMIAGEMGGEELEDMSGIEPADMGEIGDDDASMLNPSELPERRIAGLPLIHDLSGADPRRVDQLVTRALDSLGLDDLTGPEERDRVFVGQWYIAWIDETGFYGKLNGLWALNGDLDQLDFVLLDDEHPVNSLIVGEHGHGSWPGGYMGSEHIEFPNATPEEDDDPSCADTFCAQYSHAEAPRYTHQQIPAWRACNDSSPGWGVHFTPISVERNADGLEIWYEGPLTKQGDFGGEVSDQGCGQDFLFPDGQRRRVFLRTGYQLHAQDHMVDRLLQVRNPAGNPTFDGPMSFIGGFVMTQWPTPHRLKMLNRFIRVSERDVEIRWGDELLRLARRVWSMLPLTPPDHDVVLGWADQTVTLSPNAGFTLGQAYSMVNVGVDDPGDNGFCLCSVHGAIELGGGLMRDEVAGGALSAVAIRRLTIHHEDERPQVREWHYEAEGDDLQHNIGRLDQDGWSADTRLDDTGYMIYGPYAQDWGAGLNTARFRLLIDVVDARDDTVVTLEIHDADAQEIVVSRPIPRSAFSADLRYQDFTLDFNLAGRLDHAIETRVRWHDVSYVRVDKITVSE